MAKSAPLIASFNAGEWSPLVWGRSDLARYGAACRKVENFLPLAQGAATRRPGTRFIAATRDDGPARLVPFEFSVEQAYVIEFGDHYLRLYRDRARLEVAAPGAAIASGTFDTDVAGWNDLSTGGGSMSWNAGSWLELRTNANGIGKAEQAVATTTPDSPHVLIFELKRDQQARAGACTLGIGTNSGASDILTRSLHEPGFYAIPFTPGVSPFHVNFAVGNPGGRVVGIDNVSILTGPAFELPTPYPAAALDRLKWTQSADVLYLAHPDYPPMKLSRAGAFEWSLTRIVFTDGPYLPVAKEGTLSASATTGIAVTVSSDIALFAASDVGRPLRLRHGSTWGWGVITAVANAQSATVEVHSAFGGTGAATEYRLGAWSGSTGFPSCVSFFEERLFFGGTRNRPQTVWGSVVGDYENHAPSQADGDVLDDSAVTFTIADDRVNAIRWMSAGKTLAIGTAGGEFSLSAAGVNEAVSPTSVNVRRETTKGCADLQPIRIGPAVLFVQRARRKLHELVYDFQADALQAPELSILAQHMLEPGIADIALQAEPWSVIWSIRDDGALLGLTYLREQQVAGWHRHPLGGGSKARSLAVIPGAAQDELWLVVERVVGGVTRRWVEVLEHAFKPAHSLDHGGAFFVDAGLSYDGWNVDAAKTLALTGAGGWLPGSSKTLTAVGHEPFSGASIDRFYALASTDPAMLPVQVRVTAFTSPTEVTVMLTTPVHVALQAAATSNWALMTQEVAGLDHLDGETVALVADGAAHPSRVVAAGKVTLDRPAARVHAGLGYRSVLETLDIEGGAVDGTAQDRRRRIHGVSVRLVDTIGASVGLADGPLDELPFRGAAAAMDAAPPLFTGDKRVPFPKGWDRGARVAVLQDQPLPCTVAAILPRLTTNEG